MSWLWFVLGMAWAGPAEDVARIRACLGEQDVACAREVVDAAGFAEAADPSLRGVAARVAFHEGDYPRAYDLLSQAVADGLPADQLPLYERTLYATAGWVERTEGRYRIRYRPGVDAVLVDDAIATLEATDRFVTPLIGDVPPGETVVELFPDGRSFIAASSLTKDDVQTTGVTALSKWSRLLVSSPRALGRGYDWRSTLSHEYLHLVVAHNSLDEAPVWLQEGIAKYLDGFWKGTERFELGVRSEGYLAEALADDAFVPFDEMHPSLAKIKVFDDQGQLDPQASAERASLAYAQLATLVGHARSRGGDDTIARTLVAVADGVDPRVALAEAAGASSFDELLSTWKDELATLDLVDRDVEELPTVLDGGDDAELDPVLSKRKDLANFLRLGDLLADRGRHRAALVEYAQARDEEDPNSPLLASREASAHLALDQPDRAREILEASLADYPTFPHNHRLMGRLEAEAGRTGEAIRWLERSVAHDPFHYEAQTALLDLYKQTGRTGDATRQEAVLRILRRGGVDDPGEPIHERYGTYELPRDPNARPSSSRKGGALLQTGETAPDFEATTLDGEPVSLSSLSGRVVVLDFWATWCGPCRAVMPDLSRMHAELQGQGLTVVGLSDELTSTVRRFLATSARQGVTFDHVLALEGGEVRRAYGVSSLPTLYVIDRSGQVALVEVGAGDMGAIESRVRELLQ